jgi:hypothetical protein
MKGWFPIWVCTLTCSSATFAGVIQFEFEDVFGPVPTNEIVRGPGDYDFGSMLVETPDQFMFNLGHLTGTGPDGATPFRSDFLYLFTYGGGATFTFDTPIRSVSFDYGQHFNVQTSSVYGLRANGQLAATFTHPAISSSAINHFAHEFDAPVSWFTLTTVNEGSTTGLGIDSLRVQLIPEPGAVGVLAIVVAVMPSRRSRSKAQRRAHRR